MLNKIGFMRMFDRICHRNPLMRKSELVNAILIAIKGRYAHITRDNMWIVKQISLGNVHKVISNEWCSNPRFLHKL